MKKRYFPLILAFTFALAGCTPETLSLDESTYEPPFQPYYIDEPACEYPYEEDVPDAYPYSPIPYESAAGLFKGLEELFDQDDGALWGVPLHAPFLFFHRESRVVVTNQPDLHGLLTKQGDVYTGTVPEDLIFGYGTIDLGGVYWAMMEWIPGMEDWATNHSFMNMTHTVFHWIQPTLFDVDIIYFERNLHHMDEKDARISILLEVNALMMALGSQGEQRIEFIADALSIRDARRQQFDRGLDESRHEVIEGTATYTEYSLNMDRKDQIMTQLRLFQQGMMVNSPSLLWTFGYVSGSLYAFLMSDMEIDWKDGINEYTDLGSLLMEGAGITELRPLCEIDLSRYGYEEITLRETTRAREVENRSQEIINAFSDQPLLRFIDGIEHFIPSGFWFTLPEWGMVYRVHSFTGDFGRLVFSREGDVIHYQDDFFKIVALDVEVDGNHIIGSNWTLELNEGFEIQTDGEDFVVVRR